MMTLREQDRREIVQIVHSALDEQARSNVGMLLEVGTESTPDKGK